LLRVRDLSGRHIAPKVVRDEANAISTGSKRCTLQARSQPDRTGTV
jgi:hypothetical protein